MNFKLLKLDQSSLLNDLEESTTLLNNTNLHNTSQTSTSNSKTPLTAETLRILSKLKIENLSFNSQFDLLFNDLSMLKASAVQGLLKITNFRFLAWMIFLECIPMAKEKWVESIHKNREFYEQIRGDICCDPHKRKPATNDEATDTASNMNDTSFLGDYGDDHPLSQEKASTWNRYYWHKELKNVIIQDVNRM